MNPIHVAIIGCGDMGRRHAEQWSKRPDAKVVSVYDPQEDRAAALAEKTGARICKDHQEAISGSDVQAVSVCTPVCDHPKVTLFAIEQGCHVLVEKPIALTDTEAREMIQAAADKGVQLAVSYQYRSFSRYQHYRRLFQSGELGEPIFARFTDIREVRPKLAMHRKSQNGGPLIDMAGHFFDLMRWITGCEPLSVTAWGHVYGQGKKRLEGIDDLAFDAAEVLVHFEKEHVLSAFINWGMPEGFGSVSSDSLTGPDLHVEQQGNVLTLKYPDRVEKIQDMKDRYEGPEARIEDLMLAIRGEKPLEVDGKAGLRALRMSLAVLKSIESGEKIGLPKE
jgi:predicted dehydrogenase